MIRNGFFNWLLKSLKYVYFFNGFDYTIFGWLLMLTNHELEVNQKLIKSSESLPNIYRKKIIE